MFRGSKNVSRRVQKDFLDSKYVQWIQNKVHHIQKKNMKWENKME
jgi:hypothetical protein